MVTAPVAPVRDGGLVGTRRLAESTSTMTVPAGLSRWRKRSFTCFGDVLSRAFAAGDDSTSELCAQAGAAGSRTTARAAATMAARRDMILLNTIYPTWGSRSSDCSGSRGLIRHPRN